MDTPTGAHITARALRDLGVTVIFGIVGIPVVEIAEEAIDLGIRFVGFRNEQAASYAATAYGYLTGKPGVCLVVGGPGVLHAMAGVGNSHANAFPLLLLAGSSETHLVSRGAFQELDAISLLTPHTKLAIRPPSLASIPDVISTAYRTSWYGRPGTAFVDLPADLIQGRIEDASDIEPTSIVPEPPKGGVDELRLSRIIQQLKSATAPLVVIGKGAAYARAETAIRTLINTHQLPFLPTPMGKGVMPDSHPLNTASARSTALQEADVVLLLGARLNWILHFGASPKWNAHATFIQIDISAAEAARSPRTAALALVGDLGTIVPQLTRALGPWAYSPSRFPSPSYSHRLAASAQRNAAAAATKAAAPTAAQKPMTYARAFTLIKRTLHALAPPDAGAVVYVSEGANTMDISRSIFDVAHPRLRLDAGTHATMGVGLAYAVAAHVAYNGPEREGYSRATAPSKEKTKTKKKIVCLEGDSAFGFSAMEVETMARYGMDVLIFVMNNGGVYHGDSDDGEEWRALQRVTLAGPTVASSSSSSSSSSEMGAAMATASGSGSGSGSGSRSGIKTGSTTNTNTTRGGLRSTSLGWEVRYEKIAEACGGVGFFVRTEEELARATREGFESGTVTVVNVVVEAGKGTALAFGWMGSGKEGEGEGKGKKEGGAKL